MRQLLFALGVLVATAALGSRAGAQNYPWCAQYDFGGDDAVNCGFVSFEQCMATVRGIGGFCTPNNLYQAPGPAARPPHRASKHYSHRPS